MADADSENPRCGAKIGGFEMSRELSFPASNLSSTYTGIMITDVPRWIKKSCRVAYSLPACLSP